MNHETHQRHNHGAKGMLHAMRVTLWVTALGCSISLVSGAPASGPLRVCPSNPRYFADATGRAIYLTGSHTWANFATDHGYGDPPVAYVPPTGTGSRTLTVALSRLSGKARARWFNPVSGSYSEIAGSPFANSGSRDFSTPGDNGTGMNDWVLILEVKPNPRN